MLLITLPKCPCRWKCRARMGLLSILALSKAEHNVSETIQVVGMFPHFIHAHLPATKHLLTSATREQGKEPKKESTWQARISHDPTVSELRRCKGFKQQLGAGSR